jgi:hypothetical protein
MGFIWLRAGSRRLITQLSDDRWTVQLRPSRLTTVQCPLP